ncbi:hypothetical protein ACFLZN_02855, partial [Nanoarchaeota archaeon]
MKKRAVMRGLTDEVCGEERRIIWPAQESPVFWEDYKLLGRMPHFRKLDDFYGRILLVYGPVRSCKSALSLIIDNIQEYFEPAGIKRWCFVPRVMEGLVETASSRVGLKFQGETIFVDCAEDILKYAGDSFRAESILVTEAMFLDSKIIRVAHQLAQQSNKLVILEGLDLNYRGEYFSFRDHNGLTMEDLIMSVPMENRYPQISYCTAEVRESGLVVPAEDERFRLDDRHRVRARFTQRTFSNGEPCPWHDILVKLRNYREQTGVTRQDEVGAEQTEPDKYHS